jgi:hypothetical protein
VAAGALPCSSGRDDWEMGGDGRAEGGEVADGRRDAGKGDGREAGLFSDQL